MAQDHSLNPFIEHLFSSIVCQAYSYIKKKYIDCQENEFDKIQVNLIHRIAYFVYNNWCTTIKPTLIELKISVEHLYSLIFKYIIRN